MSFFDQNNNPDLTGYSSPDPLGTAIMGAATADRLQGILEASQTWPIWSSDRTGGLDTGTFAQVGGYGKSMRDIALWVAMRENDREALIQLTGWERDRRLHLDPLPERITEAFTDLLYGDEAEFIADKASDQDKMDEMATESGLRGELVRWVDQFVSEGESWYRIWTDPGVSDWPLFSVHSRLNVVPLFVGRKIVAVAFIDNFMTQEIRIESTLQMVYWRHVEIHAVGYVRNLLYKGAVGQLGTSMPLDSMPDTEDLEPEWVHGLPFMLCGRGANKIGRDFRLGISEYQGIRDLLLDLNEARTIMAENARLVLKARMVVPANAVDANGNFDAGEDVVIAESLDEELGGKNSGPYAVLEYNFPSEKLIAHKQELTYDALSRVGLAEQFAQNTRGGEGQAFTGTALRTRLVPTVQAASRKARVVDKEVPILLRKMAMLSSLPVENGGNGQTWQQPDGKHTQKRANMLPEDPNELVQRNVMAVQGEIKSIQLAVEEQHPEWSDDEVDAEVQRILEDKRMVIPTIGAPENPADPNLPGQPPGGPGSAVDTPASLLGASQPNGQSGQPTNTPPQVKAGGPK